MICKTKFMIIFVHIYLLTSPLTLYKLGLFDGVDDFQETEPVRARVEEVVDEEVFNAEVVCPAPESELFSLTLRIVVEPEQVFGLFLVKLLQTGAVVEKVSNKSKVQLWVSRGDVPRLDERLAAELLGVVNRLGCSLWVAGYVGNPFLCN